MPNTKTVKFTNKDGKDFVISFKVEEQENKIYLLNSDKLFLKWPGHLKK